MFFLHSLLRNTDWKADLGGLVSKELKERCFLCAEGPGEIGTSFSCPKWDKRVKCGNKCWGAERRAENGQNAAVKQILEISSAGTNQEDRLLVRAGSRICAADDTTQWLCPSAGLGQTFSWAGLCSINPSELNWENTVINQMLPPLSFWKIIDDGKVPNTSQCSLQRSPPIL